MDFEISQGREHLFAHMSRAALYLEPGSQIRPGKENVPTL